MLFYIYQAQMSRLRVGARAAVLAALSRQHCGVRQRCRADAQRAVQPLRIVTCYSIIDSSDFTNLMNSSEE